MPTNLTENNRVKQVQQSHTHRGCDLTDPPPSAPKGAAPLQAAKKVCLGAREAPPRLGLLSHQPQLGLVDLKLLPRQRM